jgi:hypothetical protein
MGWTTGVRFIAQESIFHVSTAFRQVLGTMKRSIRQTSAILSPRIKWPGRGGYHSPKSCAEIKNEWTCTSTPHISLWRDAEVQGFSDFNI